MALALVFAVNDLMLQIKSHLPFAMATGKETKLSSQPKLLAKQAKSKQSDYRRKNIQITMRQVKSAVKKGRVKARCEIMHN